jgi:flagellin-like hook-associated protein FlgL
MSGVINSTVAKALQTLAATNVALQKTGTEVATGKVVATVEDNPAAYVVALRLASDAQVWAAVKSGLGGAETPARVANAAMAAHDTPDEAQEHGCRGAGRWNFGADAIKYRPRCPR